ncbi:MAG TPA: DUF3545 family protein [Aliidiomarina sp.]|nr:DUF3545 family protein [Aliidiomarina sp.]
MDNSEELKNTEGKSAKGRGAKRKWREIEMLKERHSLLKELEGIDYCSSYDLDDLEL